jgi:hypothetical protein
MKKIMKAMMLVVALITCMGAQAQQQSAAKNTQTNREDFARKQALNIADQLAFDDKTTDKFVTTYSQYCKEVATLRPTRQPKRDRTEALSDEEVEQKIKNRFDRSRKLLDIQEKYYNEYSKFLTPKQIDRVYQLEKQMKRRPDGRGRNMNGPRKNQNGPGMNQNGNVEQNGQMQRPS